jgi:hypothetical protein
VSVGAIAFVPAAPLLIPDVAAGSAGLDAALREASLDAVSCAIAGAADEVVVVSAVPHAGEWSQESTWDFAGFGVARLPVGPRSTLPWSLGIGAWLLDESGWTGPRRYVGVDQADPPSTAGPLPAVGSRAIVVVGDGSACRSERAPGHLDGRAEPFDDAVADLLARGDAAGLGGLDETLAAELMCAGLPAWRWTAGAVDGERVTDAELLAHVAPYGVGYFVALWSLT